MVYGRIQDCTSGNEQKKYLVPILKEEIDINSLPKDQRDLQMYLRTYTYIDGTCTNYVTNLER